MSLFRYQATDTDGNLVEGELEQQSLADAIAELESQGKSIQSIELATRPNAPESQTVNTGFPIQPQPTSDRLSHYGTSNRLRSHFDSVFARRDELLPVLEALASELPRSSSKRDLRHLIQAIRSARSGTELSTSKHATRWLPLLLTGLEDESSTQRLGDLLAVTARESRNRSERRRVMLYPAAVFTIAFTVFVLLCAVIVPSFRIMFRDFGIRIPAPTLLVINISKYFTEQLTTTLIAMGIGIALMALLAHLWVKNSITTRVFGRFAAGNASNVSAMATLTGQLADLLSIGITLPDAIWLAGESCNHRFFQGAMQHLARHAYDSGRPLSECAVSHRLPGNLIHALTTGPNGTPHIPLLYELSALYSDHATHRANWITGAAAQLSILLLGLAVGFVVFALFAPLITLVDGLT